ncbi:MAG TPA: ABC transporter ATP-binding protein [Allocoleopsis sp.]
MIEVEQLSKVYGSTPAIQDVTFAVEPGEILGFLGPNGAGKTTTMRILTGYLPATSGRARVAGYDVHEDSMAVRQRIGYLPETPPLYPEMTVEGFLYFVARIKGVSAGDRSRQVQSAMERCSLVEKRKTLIRKLSKGFRQRVGIAQAIVHDPPAIILDEPTVGLDPRQIIEVRNLIKNLAGTHTVILSTHILPEVSMTCNRVAIINRGRVVATNSPENLMAQLNAGSGYELEVDGDVATVQQLVQPIPGVRLVEPLRTEEVMEQASAPHRCRVRVASETDSDPGRDIAAVVVGAGLGLYEMRRTRASLEDVFLQLTMTEEKAPEASSDAEAGSEATVEPVIEDTAVASVATTSESAASEPATSEGEG